MTGQNKAFKHCPKYRENDVFLREKMLTLGFFL